MKVRFSLLNGRICPGDLRSLLAVVEPGQNRALGDAVADIGAKLDQHTGYLEADLGGDARLDGAEAEDLDQHVSLRLGYLHSNRAQTQCPNSGAGGNDQCEHNGEQKDASTAHGVLPLPCNGMDRLHCRF